MRLIKGLLTPFEALVYAASVLYLLMAAFIVSGP